MNRDWGFPFGCQNKPETKKIKILWFREHTSKNQAFQKVEICLRLSRPYEFLLPLWLPQYVDVRNITYIYGEVMTILQNDVNWYKEKSGIFQRSVRVG